MGCFACFRACKDGKGTTKRHTRIPRNHRHGMQNAAERRTLFAHESPERETATEPVNLVPEQLVPAEQFGSSPKKRVTFNSNVKTYEPVLVDSTDSLLKEDRVGKEFKENVEKLKDDDSVSENDSITSSGGSYPQNHRYQNCRESDDEAEEYGNSDLEDDDDDDDGDEVGENDDGAFGGSREKEVWPESVVTELRTKNHLVRMNSEEVNSPFKAPGLADEGYSYARDRSTYAHPVLNPVENLIQWKAVKSKGISLPLKPQKENSTTDFEAPRISLSSEPTLRHLSSLHKPKPNQLKTTDQHVAVDASLSNWLVSPEPTPAKKNYYSSGLEGISSGRSGSPQFSNSAVSFEDRPILGALTVEELRHMSATNSPRKSPTHSPDDMPIIGSVGSYWNDSTSTKDSAGLSSSFKGIPNTSSKYREDKQVKWNSTPFETRLERALNNRGVAE